MEESKKEKWKEEKIKKEERDESGKTYMQNNVS